MLLLLASALCATVAQVKASIPDQPVEIVLELSGFEANPNMQTERALLAGQFGGSVNISVLFEENMPYMASDECGGRAKNEKKFLVGDVTCTEATESVGGGAAEITRYHAYPVNADYLFDIHVSITRAGKKPKADFTRAEFTSIVKSFAVTGRPDPSKQPSPPELYAFRDEAAKHAKDQMAWVTAQCKARPDDANAHFYLAQLAAHRDNEALSLAEFAAAADALERRADRAEKDDIVLFQCLDRLAAARGAKKDWSAAIGYCQRIVPAAEKSKAPKAGTFLARAHYNLAICNAQSKHAKEALESLRRAIEREPKLKESARSDELLAPIRDNPEFKKLTK